MPRFTRFLPALSALCLLVPATVTNPPLYAQTLPERAKPRAEQPPQALKKPEAPAKTQPAAKPQPPVKPSLPVPAINVRLSAKLAADDAVLSSGVSWKIYKRNGTAEDQNAQTPVWTGGGAPAEARLPLGFYEAEAQYGLAKARTRFEAVAGTVIEKTIVLETGILAARALSHPAGTLLTPAHFTLYTAKPGKDREIIGRSSAEPALFQVSPGTYTLQAQAGLAGLEAPVTVIAGRVTVIDMALNAGTLDLKAFAATGLPKLLPATHLIYRAQSSGVKGAAPLLRIEAANHRVLLPEGSYRIETIAGLVRQESRVTITAGQVTAQSIVMNAGEIRIAPPAASLLTQPELCTIRDLKAGQNGMLGRAAGPDVSFIVPAGRYRIACAPADQPSQEVRTEISVSAGETILAALKS